LIILKIEIERFKKDTIKCPMLCKCEESIPRHRMKKIRKKLNPHDENSEDQKEDSFFP